MTQSTVTTIAQTALSPLFLVLHSTASSLRERVEQLCHTMRESDLFSLAEIKAIASWEQKTASYWSSVKTDEERDRASLALSFLLIDTIRPALLRQSDEIHQAHLLQIEDHLLSLLESLLPKGSSTDDLIREVEELDQERKIYAAKLAAMKSHFQQQTDQLYEAVNVSNESLQQQFETLKQRLRALNTQRKEMTLEGQTQLDTVAKKVEKAAALLAKHAETAHTLGNRLEEEELRVQKLLHECHQLLYQV